MDIIVTTLFGLEESLSKELQDLGINSVQKLNRAVLCKGDLESVYKINYRSRLALRVLIRLGEFHIRNDQDIYNHFYNINWEEYFGIKGSFAIDTTGQNRFLRNTMYVSLKAKDAIADQFRNSYDKRPNVNPVHPTLRINIHIRHNTMTISLDSSGDSLHKRGYRIHGLDAPLNEVLAAGIIYLSRWRGENTLVDPMCGSGTLGIEAYSLAKNIPPQSSDRSFAFKGWKTFNSSIWQKVVRDAQKDIIDEEPSIIMYDKSLRAARGAGENIYNAGFKNIKVERKDFFRSEGIKNVTIVCNPPYDQRIKDDNIDEFYSKFGFKMKDDYPGSTAYIFSGNIPALKKIKLKPSKKYELYNGDIESRLFKYELY